MRQEQINEVSEAFGDILGARLNNTLANDWEGWIGRINLNHGVQVKVDFTITNKPSQENLDVHNG